jgi:hypothetical protein
MARNLSEEERMDFLVRTVLGEAVSEGPTGMMVVAQVIANRTTDARWPADPVAVAGQPWQFTTNSPGKGGNQDMVDQYGPETIEYRQAKQIVQAAIFDRSVPDLTGNAKHYHTIEMGWPATWPASVKKHGHMDIGAHRVYPDHPVPPGSIPNVANVMARFDGTAIEAAERLASGGPLEIKDITAASNFNFGEMVNPNGLVIHHTGGRGTVEGVLQTYRERNFPAHFIIDRDGTVYRALPETSRGQHIRPSQRREFSDMSNLNTWGVEIIARDDGDVLPAQATAAIALTQYLNKGYGMPTNRVVGHGYINSHKQSTEGQSTLLAMRAAGLPVADYVMDLAVGTALAINDPFTAAKTRTMMTLPTPVSERAKAQAGVRMPIEMPGDLRLQREVNRVATERRNKIYSDIRKSRVLAFNNVDPFEGGASGARITLKPQKASGSLASSARTFALQTEPVGIDAPGLTLTRTMIKPPVKQTTPWGPRETVAAAVAAADAEAGRNQLVMTGNPNIPGSVVDWLYPRIPEGQGEANQEGKGPRARVDAATASVGRGTAAAEPGMRAVAELAAREARKPGQSVIERVAPKREEAVEIGQSIIERNPRVVVSKGVARVVPQSQIERNPPDLFAVTTQRAADEQRPALATSLAAKIAARSVDMLALERSERSAQRLTAPKPTGTQLRYGDMTKPGAVVAPPQSQIERNPPKPKEITLPTDVRERELARNNPLFGQPVDGKARTVTMPTSLALRPRVTGFPTSADMRPRVTGWPTDASGRPTSPARSSVALPTAASQRPAQTQRPAPQPSSSSSGSSSSSSSASEPVKTITGSSTGKTYVVGTEYQAGGYRFVATESGFQNLGRIR